MCLPDPRSSQFCPKLHLLCAPGLVNPLLTINFLTLVTGGFLPWVLRRGEKGGGENSVRTTGRSAARMEGPGAEPPSLQAQAGYGLQNVLGTLESLSSLRRERSRGSRFPLGRAGAEICLPFPQTAARAGSSLHPRGNKRLDPGWDGKPCSPRRSGGGRCGKPSIIPAHICGTRSTGNRLGYF